LIYDNRQTAFFSRKPPHARHPSTRRLRHIRIGTAFLPQHWSAGRAARPPAEKVKLPAQVTSPRCPSTNSLIPNYRPEQQEPGPVDSRGGPGPRSSSPEGDHRRKWVASPCHRHSCRRAGAEITIGTARLQQRWLRRTGGALPSGGEGHSAVSGAARPPIPPKP
jgi:hypothetical protein